MKPLNAIVHDLANALTPVTANDDGHPDEFSAEVRAATPAIISAFAELRASAEHHTLVRLAAQAVIATPDYSSTMGFAARAALRKLLEEPVLEPQQADGPASE